MRKMRIPSGKPHEEMKEPRKLELLAPAANAEVAIEAIMHGADAIYMGGPGHGARKNAANSIEDIRRVARVAHVYRARLYVTVNTVVYDHELEEVRRMVWELWHAGVDAIIVQDMALLEMDLPPIELHASTQCDTRTPAKARFLQDVGFSQIVLARELTLKEIKEICAAISVPVECFVHGALCVSYSGRCHASQALCGRSANRGECAQICRLPYTLKDSRGKVLKRNFHALSLKDLNTLAHLEELVEAGASSFKIEGRLKEAGYVKNVTAAYRRELDRIIAASEGRYVRSSFGESTLTFRPDVAKSFNRGFTTYFLASRRQRGVFEPRTPKSLGEPVADPTALRPGDGVSWFGKDGAYEGMAVNSVSPSGIQGPGGQRLPKGVELRRTADVQWQKLMAGKTAERRLALDIVLEPSGVVGSDERGVRVKVAWEGEFDRARKPMDFRPHFEKLGQTHYRLRNFESRLGAEAFLPASAVAATRRRLVEALDQANSATLPLALRRKGEDGAVYPATVLDYRDNVANSLARRFYASHGVERMEKAAELLPAAEMKGKMVMTTRHCLLRELGCCRRELSAGALAEGPLFLEGGRVRLRLEFDCARCEMQVFEAGGNG